MSEPAVVNRPRLAPLHQPAAPLRNKIIAALRDAIESGLLAPGQRLVEMDLCAQLSVSRTSLREALRELEADGILDGSSGRGLRVRRISEEDAHNVYRLRAVVEALVIEQFIERASDVQVDALTRDSEVLCAAYRAGDLQEILSAKHIFYDRICAGARNDMAFDIINRLVLRTSALRARSVSRRPRQEQSVTEIASLVAAIRRRDVQAAREAALAHAGNAEISALNAG